MTIGRLAIYLNPHWKKWSYYNNSCWGYHGGACKCRFLDLGRFNLAWRDKIVIVRCVKSIFANALRKNEQ